MRKIEMLIIFMFAFTPYSIFSQTNQADLERRVAQLEKEIAKLEMRGDVDTANLRSQLREMKILIENWFSSRSELAGAVGSKSSNPQSFAPARVPAHELADGRYEVKTEEVFGNYIWVSVAEVELSGITLLKIKFHANLSGGNIDTSVFNTAYLSDDLGNKYPLQSFDKTFVTKIEQKEVIVVHSGEDIYVHARFPRLNPKAKKFQLYLPTFRIINFSLTERIVEQ